MAGQPKPDVDGDPEQTADPNVVPSLAQFTTAGYQRGRPWVVEALWMMAQWLILSSWFPGSIQRRILLRSFGARIGRGVTIKPGVRVKFPWRLTIGDHSWIGENAWIDNLAMVQIGADCCISQGAYLCTGSHDWQAEHFDLIVKPITLHDYSWVAASATIGPGVTIGTGAVLGLGGVATKDLEPWGVYGGSPATWIKKRRMRFLG